MANNNLTIPSFILNSLNIIFCLFQRNRDREFFDEARQNVLKVFAESERLHAVILSIKDKSVVSKQETVVSKINNNDPAKDIVKLYKEMFNASVEC